MKQCPFCGTKLINEILCPNCGRVGEENTENNEIPNYV